MRTRDAFVKDRKGKEYKVVVNKGDKRVTGTIYTKDNKNYIGKVWGGDRREMLKNLKNNIDILVYD